MSAAPSAEEPASGGSPRIRPYLRASPPAAHPGADSRAKPGIDAGPDAGSGAGSGEVAAWTGSGSREQPAQDAHAGPRPFILTAGRVAGADPEIVLETQVTARTAGPPWPAVPVSRLPSELQAIVALCREPVSVAEVSARLGLHLGVTRVLVGDLRAAGHLDVHIRDVADPLNPETIMRVIRGLRAIS